MGENIIIISISAKSRSVAPVKLEINLISPKREKNNAKIVTSKLFRLYISEKKITQKTLRQKFFAYI